jgi:hypothetical protein
MTENNYDTLINRIIHGDKPSFQEIIASGNPVKDRHSIAYTMAFNGCIFSITELKILEKMRKGESWRVIYAMTSSNRGYFLPPSEFLSLNPSPKIVEMYAEIMDSQHKGKMIVEMTTLLRQIKDFSYTPALARLMAKHGFMFNMDELIQIGNLPEGYEWATSAHWMARNGYRFTIDELLRLGNPATKIQSLLRLEHDFIIESTEDDYQNRWGIAHDGATVAHIMAREGYRFSVDEIKALGNPKDAAGRTLADWMGIKGNPLTDAEMEELK